MPEPEQLVHWRGLDAQETFDSLGVHHPTRCGLFDVTALLGFPLAYVTCPRCIELTAADEAAP